MYSLILELAIIILIFVLLVAVIPRIVKRIILICPVCGYEFRLTVSAYTRAFHILWEREATCPNCGYHGLMKEYWEKK